MNSQVYQKLVDVVNTLTEAAKDEGWCDGWDAGHAAGVKEAEQRELKIFEIRLLAFIRKLQGE